MHRQIIAELDFIQCVPRKGFGSAVCVGTEGKIDCVYIVSQSADPNHFRGTVE